MKYLIGYKQNEDTYLYVNNIGTTVGVTLAYYGAIDFISEKDANNVCNFLKKYDAEHEYIVLKYEYSIEEIN